MGKPIPYRVQAKFLHQISTITAYSDPSASSADSSPYAGEPRGGAVVFRFRRQFRYRASAITVWVQPQCATKKCLPLEGKVSPKVTDEVFSNPFAAGKHNLLSALKPFREAKPNKRA